MRTILLTGGAGFIGSACLRRFLERGDRVIVVDNFEPTLYPRPLKEENLAWARQAADFEFVEYDIRDAPSMRSIFANNSIDVVVHLAAVAGVRPSIENAPLYFDINVTATSLLLELARDHGVEDIVLASSSSVYGGNTKTPFSEDDPVESPVSPYAASKLALEILAQTHHHLHGGNLTCLRFFTVYGPRQRPEMAIHKFMRIIDDGETIPMFGDGTTGRDYTYIDDIVQGVERAVDSLGGFAIYNLGGDKVVLLKDLIDIIAEVVGKPAQIEQLPMQPGDVALTMADLTRARAELGYSPTTSIRDGVAKMWAWYSRRSDDHKRT